MLKVIDPIPDDRTRNLIEKVVDQNGIILQQNAKLMELLQNPICIAEDFVEAKQ